MSSQDGISRWAVRRALFDDALAQVLDNRVFRILALLTVVLVALTFMVGFREDEVVLLWGWRSYLYDDFLDYFPVLKPFMSNIDDSQRVAVISAVQSMFVDFIAGSFGILFSVAATVFFVPQMLEKGMADTLFTKAVSRWALLWSRYLASVLFVALLAVLMIGGTHLGLLVASGYSDASYLWTIPSIVYRFLLVMSFAVVFGVWFRNITASLLLTLVAYGATTGVHTGWIVAEFVQEREEFSAMLETSTDSEETEQIDTVARALLRALVVAHYVLPKTHDATYITRRLRERIADHRMDEVKAFLVGRTAHTLEWNEERVTVRSPDNSTWSFGRGTFEEQDTVEFSTRRRDVALRLDADGAPQVRVDGEPAELVDPPEDSVALYNDPFEWYEAQFDWHSPWRFNAWFSLLSSLGFVFGALGLAWVRLRRINF